MAAKPFLRRLNCVKLKIILANRTKIYSLGERERERKRERERERQLCILIYELTRGEEGEEGEGDKEGEREREAIVYIDLWTHQKRGDDEELPQTAKWPYNESTETWWNSICLNNQAETNLHNS